MKKPVHEIFCLRKESGLMFILLLAILIRILFYIGSDVNNASKLEAHVFAPPSDSNGYHRMAINLAHSGNFLADEPSYIFDFFTLDSIRTPGYPLFLAFIYMIFGSSPQVVILIQLFLSLLSVLLVYKIALILGFSVFPANLAALLYALDIHSIFFVFELYTETLFVFVLLIAVHEFLKSTHSGGKHHLVISGFLLGVLALIRPIALYFPIVFILLFLLFKKTNFRTRIANSAILTAAFLLIISFWCVRNYLEYGAYKFSAITSRNLYFFNAVMTESNSSELSVEEIESDFMKKALEKGMSKQKNPYENAGIARELGLNYIQNNHKKFIWQHIKGIVNLYISTSHRQILNRLGISASEGGKKYSGASLKRLFAANNSELSGALLIIGYLLFCYVFAAVGFFRMLKDKKYWSLLLLTAIIVYFSFLTGIAGSPRFKIPVIPFYLIMAGYGFSVISMRFSKIQDRIICGIRE